MALVHRAAGDEDLPSERDDRYKKGFYGRVTVLGKGRGKES